MLYLSAHIAEAVGIKSKTTLFFTKSGDSWIFTNRKNKGWKEAKVYAVKSKGSRKRYYVEGDGLHAQDNYCWRIRKKGREYFELEYCPSRTQKEDLLKMIEIQESVRKEALERYRASKCQAYKVIAERAEEAIRNLKERLNQL